MRMGRTLLVTLLVTVVMVGAAPVWTAVTLAVEPAQPEHAPQFDEIAVEAYVYAYPLVLAELTRRAMTSFDAAGGADRRAPMNQFSHRRTFPDAKFTNVVRPNADTLYSSLWYDVSSEPLLISVPDSQGRYYLLPILDMWTDVFASPGTRTTGSAGQVFAIVGPSWHGDLPDGARMIRAPTPVGWLIGRTQTNGAADFENVHHFQDRITATPLSQWGKTAGGPKAVLDLPISHEPPVEQVTHMNAASFFGLFAELLKTNPPHGNDYPILARLERIGIVQGKAFDVGAAPQEVRSALERAVPAAQALIAGSIRRAGTWVNHWRMVTPPIGTYGTDYLRRAGVAYMGLGANVIEDSLYFTGFGDGNDQNLDSGKRYTLRFAKDRLPPVRAFWSLTVYNERQFFAENRLGRYALGDRDKLQFAPDGSLTLFIQRDSPGSDKESNWLPAPASGEFTLSLRLYWPTTEALDGGWLPPAVERQP